MVSNSSGSILGTLFTKSSKYLPILVSGWILLAFKCKCWNKFNFNIQHAYLNRNYNHTCIYQFSEKVSYPELTSTSSTYSKTSVSFSWRLEHARSTWVKSLTMLTVRLLLDFPCWIKSTGKKHVIFNIYSFWHLSVLLQNNHVTVTLIQEIFKEMSYLTPNFLWLVCVDFYLHWSEHASYCLSRYSNVSTEQKYLVWAWFNFQAILPECN